VSPPTVLTIPSGEIPERRLDVRARLDQSKNQTVESAESVHRTVDVYEKHRAELIGVVMHLVLVDIVE
jgi:NADH:ubiquinone oxidoreductase subunit C